MKEKRLKQSKHSPKKLPSNQVGEYLLLDPYCYINSLLEDWYYDIDSEPNRLDDEFTQEECIEFAQIINKNWHGFEEKALSGFKEDLGPYLDLPEKSNQKDWHKFSKFDSWELIPQIARRIANYNVLMEIKRRMEEILVEPKRLKIFYKKDNITPKKPIRKPGQPEHELLKTLIADLEELCDKYYPDLARECDPEAEVKKAKKSYRPYRSVLAFYLAKQDIFGKLKCVNKKNSTDPCSATDCISLEKDECIEEVRDRYQKYDPEEKPYLSCQKRFNYVYCRRCKDSLQSSEQEKEKTFQLFLDTPCESALKRYNDIAEKIRIERAGGHIGYILEMQEKLKSARLNKDREAISKLYRKAEQLFPSLSSKKIQRILSK